MSYNNNAPPSLEQGNANGFTASSVEETDDQKHERRTKYMLWGSIIPGVGCANWVYNRFLYKVEPGTVRHQQSHLALLISCFAALFVFAWVIYSIVKPIFYVIVAAVVCVLIGCIVSPDFRAKVLATTASVRSRARDASVEVGQRAGEAAIDYAKQNPDQLYKAANYAADAAKK